MRIVRFASYSGPQVGILRDDEVFELAGSPFGDFEVGLRMGTLAQVRLLAPCEPTKVVAVGLNYKDHAQEMGQPLPEEPILFMKPPTAVVGPGEPVLYPSMSSRVDHEAELAVVIGREARALTPDQVADHILGYTCLNDVTARDLQAKDGQWTRAKSFDTFCPLGPWIETELDPADLSVEAYVNGARRQSSRTSQLIFDVFELVSFISHVMKLNAGDVVATGTPSGVGPVEVGDRMEIRVEGIGSLVNTVERGA